MCLSSIKITTNYHKKSILSYSHKVVICFLYNFHTRLYTLIFPYAHGESHKYLEWITALKGSIYQQDRWVKALMDIWKHKLWVWKDVKDNIYESKIFLFMVLTTMYPGPSHVTVEVAFIFYGYQTQRQGSTCFSPSS